MCYTFNSGKVGHRILKVNRAGVDFALRLQLNVQQDQYYGSLRDSAGFKVMVHDQEEPAMINELGFAIQPGSHTFCSLKKIVVSEIFCFYDKAKGLFINGNDTFILLSNYKSELI